MFQRSEMSESNDLGLMYHDESPVEVGNRLVDAVVIYMAFLSLPALALSLARTYTIGWNSIYYIHIAAVFIIWGVMILRRRITTGTKAAVLATLMFVLGFTGLLSFGLASASLLEFAVSCLLCTVFWGKRVALTVLGLSTVACLITLAAVNRGMISFRYNATSYAASPLTWMLNIVGLLLFTGAMIIILGTVLDSLRGSRQRLVTIIDTTPNVAIEGYDIDGRVIFWNHAAEHLFGYTAEEAINKTLDHLMLTPEEAAVYIERLRYVAATGRACGPFDCSGTRADGHRFWTLSTIFEVPAEKEQKRFICMDIDITGRKHAEAALREGEAEKRRFFRDTLSSVTDGRLQVVALDETKPYIDSADFLMEISLPEDLAGVRERAGEYFQEKGLTGEELKLFLSGLNEAVTNALKHAGGGKVFAGYEEDEVWAGITDTGPGITTLTLPHATLHRGYSTKTSMGMGYSIMLDVSDCIMLSTGPEGTTVILFKSTVKVQSEVRLEELPDTWDSISSM